MPVKEKKGKEKKGIHTNDPNDVSGVVWAYFHRHRLQSRLSSWLHGWVVVRSGWKCSGWKSCGGGARPSTSGRAMHSPILVEHEGDGEGEKFLGQSH
jgi:hypothetical protein